MPDTSLTRHVWIMIGLFLLPACEGAKNTAVELSESADAADIAESPAHDPPKAQENEAADYAALYNDHYGRGVESKDNAVRYLVEALGPDAVSKKRPADIYRKLELTALPADGRYIDEKLPDDPRDSSQRMDEDQLAVSRPWKADEFPWIAKWLTAMEEPLRLAEQASRCKHYYVPAPADIADWPLGMTTTYIGNSRLRAVAWGFSQRAMLHAGDGRMDEAWADLMTVQRLSSRLHQGGNTGDIHMAYGFEATAFRAMVGYFQYQDITPVAAAKRKSDLNKWGQPDFADIYDHTDRYSALAWFDQFQHGEAEGWSMMLVGTDHTELVRRASNPENFDAALRKRVNHHFDELARAARLPIYQKQKAAFEQIEANYRYVAQHEVSEEAFRAMLRDAPSDKQRARLVVDRLLQWLYTTQDTDASWRFHGELRRRMLRVVLALAIFRTDNGQYPARLEQLVPRYLESVPSDPLIGRPLFYDLDFGGYALWSPGGNGLDEFTWSDVWTGHDDIVVRDDRQFARLRREAIADWKKRGAILWLLNDEKEKEPELHPDEIFSANFHACTDFGDEDMAMVGTLGDLSYLILANTQITDAGVAHLKRLSHLKEISLEETRVSDRGLAHLSELKDLESVRVRGANVTDAGIARLQNAIPGVEIEQ